MYWELSAEWLKVCILVFGLSMKRFMILDLILGYTGTISKQLLESVQASRNLELNACIHVKPADWVMVHGYPYLKKISANLPKAFYDFIFKKTAMNWIYKRWMEQGKKYPGCWTDLHMMLIFQKLYSTKHVKQQFQYIHEWCIPSGLKPLLIHMQGIFWTYNDWYVVGCKMDMESRFPRDF